MENAPSIRPAEDSFQIIDRLDDEIIEAELKNRVISTWSYSFRDKEGRLQEGLSKVGVDEACVEMSKRGYIIREGKITWERDPTDPQYVLFQAPASLVRITTEGQEALMDTVNGTKRQWVKMKLKSGSIVDDPFWFEKGAMKASRNARARLIPSETKTKILLLARQKGKTQDIGENYVEKPSTDEKKTSKGKPPKSTGKYPWANKGEMIVVIKGFKDNREVYDKVLEQHYVKPYAIGELNDDQGKALYDDLIREMEKHQKE